MVPVCATYFTSAPPSVIVPARSFGFSSLVFSGASFFSSFLLSVSSAKARQGSRRARSGVRWRIIVRDYCALRQRSSNHWVDPATPQVEWPH